MGLDAIELPQCMIPQTEPKKGNLNLGRSIEMRMHLLGIALAFAIMLSFPAAASAQTKQPSDMSKVQSSDPAHDLSGIWFDDHPRPNTVMERYWIYKFTDEEPPMTPWGKAQFDAAKSSFGAHAYPLMQTNDSVYHTCTPAGFPRAYLHPFPIQIVQSPGEVLVLFEWDSLRHQIFTDGRTHDTTLGPQWMGDSIGHWEGDTLVTDTVNFNDKTWVDRMGHPHSEALHVIERIRRIDHDHLVNDITIEDPKAYTKPWTAHLDFVLKPKWTLQEQFCEDQNTFEGIENKEIKPAK
jgi:hypothetical protein